MKTVVKKTNEALLLVPEKFLEEISEKQERIIELLSGEIGSAPQLGDFIPEVEAAKLLGRKTTWFWNLRKAGILPFSKVGNKVYYSRKDIIEILEKNKKGGRYA